MDYSERISRIEQKFLDGYKSYSSSDRRVDERTGAAHGRKQIPSLSETVHPFRDGLVIRAHKDLAEYRAAIQDYWRELEAEEARLLQERDEFYAKRRDEIREEFSGKIESIERTLGPNSSKHSSLRTAHNDARSRLGRLEAELGRPLRIRLRWAFPFIMAAVALLEVPVNRFAFEYFFGESPILALLLALGLGSILAMAAHWVGNWLKHSTAFPTLKDRLGYYAGIALVMLVVGPLFYLLALVREKYIRFVESTSVSFQELLQRDGVVETASGLLATELTAAGWTLLFLNVALFGAGVAASFLRHDAHPDYETLTRRTQRLAKRCERIQARYEKKTNELTKARDEQLGRLDRQQERLTNELSAVEQAKQQADENLARTPKSLALHIKQRLQAYELANRMARSDGSVPQIFNRFDEAIIQDEIEKVVVDFPGADAQRRSAG